MIENSIPEKYFDEETCVDAWYTLMCDITCKHVDQYEAGDIDTPKIIMKEKNDMEKIVNVIIIIRRLRSAFQKTCKISGQEGVSADIGITPSAIYLQLNYVGLSAPDFREGSSFVDLFKKSGKIQNLLSRIRHHVEEGSV